MMYDELIKRLWECASGECFNCSQYTPTTNASVCQKELMKQASDAIEELQAQLMYSNDAAKAIAEKVPKWIPVTERLPEIHTNVLVMDKAHDMAVGSLEKLWDGEVWVCPFADVEDEQCPITHWMPLPEPPKGE